MEGCLVEGTNQDIDMRTIALAFEQNLSSKMVINFL
jgi:hypothetical protein